MSDVHPPNRLAGETSPYLLQHARNPVDWFAWGEEAFAAARARDVPIFLSIGYSTCYWCHVMERESFESAAMAARMNGRFVCVKVDREERPDVDDVYMAAVQAFSGQGGWPMSVFLEPTTLRPFFAGTYFPSEPRFQGMPTFPQVLDNIAEAWAEQRGEVMAQAEELADAVRERVGAGTLPVKIGDEQVTSAVSGLLRMFDRNHGGFGGAGRGPKFPQPVFIELLLDARRAAADEQTQAAIDAAIRTTLDKMACGGIHDHVGGGFHRYSVDGQWIVPHFEKMLYDNAQLAEVYAKAAVLYADSFYRRTAVRTLDYVLREMTGAGGEFFSAQDAEVNHREGQNYLWTGEQMSAVLGEGGNAEGADARFAGRVYGVDRGANFRDPHHPSEAAGNVLCMPDRPAALAARHGMTEEDLLARLDAINARLYEARAKRDQPLLDDKSLASWNGLMIRALAVSGALLGEPRYVQAAARAAEFVLEQMRDRGPEQRGGGELLRTFRAGTAKTPAFLEDYAFVAGGLIELHNTGVEPNGRYLDAARELLAEARRRFGGSEGGFFDTAAGQSDLFVRARSSHDGAVPSGSGAMLHALLDLAHLAGDASYRERAIEGLVAASGDIAGNPVGTCNSVRALMRVLASARGELEAALAKAAADAPRAMAPEGFTPVEIHASADRVEVREGKPGGLVLRVRIADGYHLTAADPAPGKDSGGLAAFRVHIINGGGVRAFADYPAGEPYGDGGELRVYLGGREFDLPVVMERSGAWSGQPLLAVTFQPCTDGYCLSPRTVELDVAIDKG